MISLKSPHEIDQMRTAGKMLARVVHRLQREVRSGMTTLAVSDRAEELILAQGAIPAFKGYQGFPAAACISINDEVVHGIPSNQRVLQAGDVLKLDLGVQWQGYYADMAVTIAVGEVTPEAAQLISTTREALDLGIAQARVGNHVGAIGHAIQQHVEQHGLSIVRDMVGHGIGTHLHEEPQVPNWGEVAAGPILQEGMVIAIEPMVAMGDGAITTDHDGWTTRTRDHSLSAHWEHTVAVTVRGPKVLTATSWWAT